MNRRESLMLLLGGPLLLSAGALRDASFAAPRRALAAGNNFSIASNGKASCVIVRQAGATPPEVHAVNELGPMLQKITGTNFEVRESLAERLVENDGCQRRYVFPESFIAEIKKSPE
jgi:hypothetical protein